MNKVKRFHSSKKIIEKKKKKVKSIMLRQRKITCGKKKKNLNSYKHE